jgi:hypothetical protein
MKYDVKKIVILMFAGTICTIMLSIITSFIFYGPGSGRKESVDIVGNILYTMLGLVIAYIGNKTDKDDNPKGV